jgi:hypothetical protein
VAAVIAAAAVFTIALDVVWQTYWSHADYWGDAAMVVFWRTGLATAFGALCCSRRCFRTSPGSFLRSITWAT